MLHEPVSGTTALHGIKLHWLISSPDGEQLRCVCPPNAADQFRMCREVKDISVHRPVVFVRAPNNA